MTKDEEGNLMEQRQIKVGEKEREAGKMDNSSERGE